MAERRAPTLELDGYFGANLTVDFGLNHWNHANNSRFGINMIAIMRQAFSWVVKMRGSCTANSAALAILRVSQFCLMLLACEEGSFRDKRERHTNALPFSGFCIWLADKGEMLRSRSQREELATRRSRFASLFSHVVEFRFGIVEFFLFGGDVVTVLAVVFGVLAWVAEAVAGVAVVVGGSLAVLALEDIEFALEQ